MPESRVKKQRLIGQDARLWYGIGILYDRYGSFEHAEEAFSSVLKMEPSKSWWILTTPF